MCFDRKYEKDELTTSRLCLAPSLTVKRALAYARDLTEGFLRSLLPIERKKTMVKPSAKAAYISVGYNRASTGAGCDDATGIVGYAAGRFVALWNTQVCHHVLKCFQYSLNALGP
jgi:hypothetical protein